MNNAACEAAVWFRDEVLAKDYLNALTRYELLSELQSDLNKFREELGADMGIASDGRLAFAQVAATIKANTDLLNNILGFTPAGMAVGQASKVYAALQALEVVQQKDDHAGLAVSLAAELSPAGKVLKLYHDVYSGIQKVANLGAERDKYVKAAREQFDNLDAALQQAQAQRLTLKERLQVLNESKEGIDRYLLERCKP